MYYLSILGKDMGPFTLEELQELAKQGRLSEDTVVKVDGKTMKAGEVEGVRVLFELLEKKTLNKTKNRPSAERLVDWLLFGWLCITLLGASLFCWPTAILRLIYFIVSFLNCLSFIDKKVRINTICTLLVLDVLLLIFGVSMRLGTITDFLVVSIPGAAYTAITAAFIVSLRKRL